jgi:pimeloyl-ACP methyl ester carboxylesterase
VSVRAAALGAVAAAAGYVAERAIMGRERGRLDPAANDTFGPPAGVVHRTIDVDDGGAIHVVEHGGGRPLVLLHGVTLTYEVWNYQLHDLSDRFRVITVDQRGHGMSTVGRDGLGLPRMGADLAAVLEALDLRGAVVVGHSMGGMVLQQFAVDFPAVLRDRVAGIVLLSTTSRSAPQLALAGVVARIAIPAGRRGIPLAARLPGGFLPSNDLSYIILRLGFGRRPSPTYVELTRTIEAAMSPESLATLLGELFRFDVHERLPGIDVPALVVVGTVDRLTPLVQARLMADQLPDVELAVCEGAGHMLMFERRAELHDLLVRFAARTAGAEMAQR